MKIQRLFLKSFLAILLMLSILFTSACATSRDNAGDGGEALPENVEQEQEQEQEQEENEPEIKIFYTSSYSFGEGVPVFSVATLSDIFRELGDILSEHDKIAVIKDKYTRIFLNCWRITYEETDGNYIIDSITNDGNSVYLMFLSCIIEQYSEYIASFDYAYIQGVFNIEPSNLLFLSFDYKELGYETALDCLKYWEANRVVLGENTYCISAWHCFAAPIYQTVGGNMAEVTLKNMGFEYVNYRR